MSLSLFFCSHHPMPRPGSVLLEMRKREELKKGPRNIAFSGLLSCVIEFPYSTTLLRYSERLSEAVAVMLVKYRISDAPFSEARLAALPV